jgi:PAS domain-containing protein
VLKDAGVVLFPGIQRLDGWVDFLIASMYLIAALILKVSSSERASTQVRLRLVEANEKTSEPGKGAVIVPPEPVNLLDSSPLAAFAVDIAGTVVYWNAAAERLMGWKRDEVLGQPPPCGTTTLRNKQGQAFGAAVWTAPVRTPSGATRGTLIMAAEESTVREALTAKAELAVQN